MIGNIEYNKFYNPSQDILDLYNVQEPMTIKGFNKQV